MKKFLYRKSQNKDVIHVTPWPTGNASDLGARGPGFDFLALTKLFMLDLFVLLLFVLFYLQC